LLINGIHQGFRDSLGSRIGTPGKSNEKCKFYILAAVASEIERYSFQSIRMKCQQPDIF
jgi:hypothetical protein